MKNIPESDSVMFSSIFSDSIMFCGTLRNTNYLLCQKNLFEVDERVRQSKIVLMQMADNTGRKT